MVTPKTPDLFEYCMYTIRDSTWRTASDLEIVVSEAGHRVTINQQSERGLETEQMYYGVLGGQNMGVRYQRWTPAKSLVTGGDLPPSPSGLFRDDRRPTRDSSHIIGHSVPAELVAIMDQTLTFLKDPTTVKIK